MNFHYGSIWHILSIALNLAIPAGLYFILRKRSVKTQKIVIAAIIAVNLLQHLFKYWIWPHKFTAEFTFERDNTAYNMCAFLIIATPIIFFIGSDLWKNFITYVGSVAGFIAIAVPFWFEGGSVFSWEYLRFFVCHALLFTTSILPALLGIYKIRYRKFWKIGLVFFLALILIIFNNLAWAAMKGNVKDWYALLRGQDPCFVMGPPEKFPIFEKIASALTPSIFLGGDGKPYVPILWYAIPMYLLITVLTFCIGAAVDRKTFLSDMAIIREKFSAIFRKFGKKKDEE